jgi:hypothetical protein
MDTTGGALIWIWGAGTFIITITKNEHINYKLRVIDTEFLSFNEKGKIFTDLILSTLYFEVLL